MRIDKLVAGIADSGDLGSSLRRELEEGISPITERVDKLEKKIDMLILTMRSIDESLKKLQPLYDLVVRLPFFKK
jgi:tetrahydromethanopterin S-methyltransferase subunit B